MNMMKTITLLLLLLPSTSSFAWQPEAYPGWFWSNTLYDFKRFEGFGNQGNLTQGIQWLTLPGEISATTYASYRWRIRTQNREFFDAHGPVLGVMFTKGLVNFGFEYEWQKYPFLNNVTVNNASLFMTWFLRERWIGGSHPTFFGIPVVGFPTTTWGRLNYDFNNIEGAGAMGYVSQAVDWAQITDEIVLRTHLTYNWRLRTKNSEFFNMHGPSIGTELVRDAISLGGEYGIQYFPSLQQEISRFQIYLNVYLDWGNRVSE